MTKIASRGGPALSICPFPARLRSILCPLLHWSPCTRQMSDGEKSFPDKITLCGFYPTCQFIFTDHFSIICSPSQSKVCNARLGLGLIAPPLLKLFFFLLLFRKCSARLPTMTMFQLISSARCQWRCSQTRWWLLTDTPILERPSRPTCLARRVIPSRRKRSRQASSCPTWAWRRWWKSLRACREVPGGNRFPPDHMTSSDHEITQWHCHPMLHSHNSVASTLYNASSTLHYCNLKLPHGGCSKLDGALT